MMLVFAGASFQMMDVLAQSDFNIFWEKFRTAVLNDDKVGVVALTSFPLLMPFGISSVTNKDAFLNKYNSILNMEADVKRCFLHSTPQPEGNGYDVYCTFKRLPESSHNRPIRYHFGRKQGRWQFEGIDNINE